MLTDFNLDMRDVVIGFMGLFMTGLGFIFKSQLNRISNLEENKVDKEVHESRFEEVIRRLDAQDESAIRRDDKLDRILDRMLSK